MAKHGAATTGGTRPSNRSPVSGSSAETRGEPAWTSAPTWCATRRTIRSASAGDDAAAGVLEPAGQPVDPEPAVGVEHHLDDAGIFEVAGDGRPERRAQHARAPGEGFGPK